FRAAGIEASEPGTKQPAEGLLFEKPAAEVQGQFHAISCRVVASANHAVAWSASPIDYIPSTGRMQETAMSEALIFDALRTPRGKGKRDGSLYEVKPVSLIAGLLRQLQARHDFDTAEVEDVVLGCVMPVGEQGG